MRGKHPWITKIWTELCSYLLLSYYFQWSLFLRVFVIILQPLISRVNYTTGYKKKKKTVLRLTGCTPRGKMQLDFAISQINYQSIWRFPEMGVPNNGWFLRKILLEWMIWGSPIYGNPHFIIPYFTQIQPCLAKQHTHVCWKSFGREWPRMAKPASCRRFVPRFFTTQPVNPDQFTIKLSINLRLCCLNHH